MDPSVTSSHHCTKFCDDPSTLAEEDIWEVEHSRSKKDFVVDLNLCKANIPEDGAISNK